MTKTLSAFALLCAFVAPAAAQTLIHVPDNAPPLTAGNTIPFGSAAYTYMVKIPASFLLATDTRIDEVAMMPAFTGTWTAPNILIGFGHLPTTVPCPFTFPGPGAATIGSFLDFTVAYNSATQGPLSWPCVNNAWCPLGFAALGGTGFVWDGVHDVGFYFTYSGASGGGSIRRAPNGPNTRTYAASYQAATSTACEALFAAYVQLTVSPNGGLNANFTPTSASGAAALTVNFFDASTSDDPNGIQSWAWDFDGDNVVDSTAQNPTFVYVTPGVYTVSLTVT
ncbi:MAG TPA: PKD domain-containing protein, partial [Planctomycetota bacterium]|nr:PKD domain-containing protein [Planctomycetota bacterium]